MTPHQQTSSLARHPRPAPSLLLLVFIQPRPSPRNQVRPAPAVRPVGLGSRPWPWRRVRVVCDDASLLVAFATSHCHFHIATCAGSPSYSFVLSPAIHTARVITTFFLGPIALLLASSTPYFVVVVFFYFVLRTLAQLLLPLLPSHITVAAAAAASVSPLNVWLPSTTILVAVSLHVDNTLPSPPQPIAVEGMSYHGYGQPPPGREPPCSSHSCPRHTADPS